MADALRVVRAERLAVQAAAVLPPRALQMPATAAGAEGAPVVASLQIAQQAFERGRRGLAVARRQIGERGLPAMRQFAGVQLAAAGMGQREVHDAPVVRIGPALDQAVAFEHGERLRHRALGRSEKCGERCRRVAEAVAARQIAEYLQMHRLQAAGGTALPGPEQIAQAFDQFRQA